MYLVKNRGLATRKWKKAESSKNKATPQAIGESNKVTVSLGVVPGGPSKYVAVTGSVKSLDKIK